MTLFLSCVLSGYPLLFADKSLDLATATSTTASEVADTTTADPADVELSLLNENASGDFVDLTPAASVVDNDVMKTDKPASTPHKSDDQPTNTESQHAARDHNTTLQTDNTVHAVSHDTNNTTADQSTTPATDSNITPSSSSSSADEVVSLILTAKHQ